MKKIFQKVVQEQLISRGIKLSRATNKEKVQSLIQQLNPYDIGIDLIRLGPKGDGGYLVPDDLEGIAACFSPGVDQISGFEEDCYNLGMQLFLADKSVDKPNLKLGSNKFNFIKKFVGCTVNEDFITMEDWVKSSNIKEQSDMLLQMDIEGHEYFTLINMSNSLINKFRIIVIEFHSLEKLWDSDFYNLASTVFNKILQSHTCVHIHPNNCCGIDRKKDIEIPKIAEFTFIRNDRFEKKTPQIVFPHKLDFDNTTNAHISLPEIWYKAQNFIHL
ncbi:MAG: FkbM family methyltransferase [Bacteroidales bacterium]|nr:FkbM family methyltransferase [Bacteroidales bacterium]